MVVTCHIDFDNNELGVFFAGQIVTGKVTLTADKPKQVKNVALKVYGFARTHWSEDNDGKTQDFSAHEEYIKSVTYLIGADDDQSHVIAPGIHTYNFACQIPDLCPSSFVGLYGRIQYFVKIALTRPWKFDQIFTKGFSVLKVLNLNYESPILRVPASTEIEKTYCCGPCQSEPMKMHVSLPQSGYVPGENIRATVTINNESIVPVKEINVALVMSVRYYASFEYKTERITTAKIKGDEVLRYSKKVFSYELPVPATPMTCLNVCGIIQITYEVCVEAKVKGMHISQVIAIPVTIGNVPLEGGVIQQQPLTAIGVQRNLDSENANNLLHQPFNSSPPSYAEAMPLPAQSYTHFQRSLYGDCDFVPRYPVFNFQHNDATTQQPMNKDEVDGMPKSSGTWL